ncbi:hypothetical protein PMI04_018365 [Sphingobium sp. AP49]|uniref:hypothetical protein n=1 Tax=Sphingobium sp. AP49 TaxID=1144307 RepID=UPI00026EE170|nr:hypothetical protein [Sphingobium sp. AP49]WHO38484.1 hypothetical protein PMI04_018365 [Sphingobium sp. AP49]
MPPIDADPAIEATMLHDFQLLVLETLVPLGTQRRMPAVRDIWDKVIASKPGQKAMGNFYRNVMRSNRSVFDSVRVGLQEGDPDVLLLKNTFYRQIGRAHSLFDTFFGRTITNGNEQCPYWDKSAYTVPPKRN